MFNKTALFLISLLTFLLYYPAIASQIVPFRINIDFAQFSYNLDSVYLEIYYSYDKAQLTYVAIEDNKYEGAVLLNVTVSSMIDNSLLIDRWWRAPYAVSDTANIIPGKKFIMAIGLIIPQGKHLLKVTGLDSNDRSRKDRSSYEIPEIVFVSEKTILSDLQLCASIRKISKDHRNPFYKNTFEVIPNPSRMYGVGRPVVYYYIEVYNLPIESTGGMYHTKVVIYDSDNHDVATQEKSKRCTNKSSVEVGTVNINWLPSGSYKFVFLLTDSTRNQTIQSEKKFFIYNPHQDEKEKNTSELSEVLAMDYRLMTEDELDKEFAVARYIALDSERSNYSSLTSLDVKREFLFNFWMQRDLNPQAPMNEFKQMYMSRVEYSNIHFGTGFKEGWKTDRGRVFIMYGEPDEYERHINEMGTKPYEVWYYQNILSGVQFVFVDRFGFQDYELVHSTHWNELHDINWRYKIRDK